MLRLTEPHSERPLFITGVPKSGTSIVANLVRNHPDFVIDFDNEAIQQFMWYVKKTMEDYFFLKAAKNLHPLEEQIVDWHENDFEVFRALNRAYFTQMHLVFT